MRPGHGHETKGLVVKRILGLVTARGSSKGLPGKNIKILAGKPLIAWTIEAALQSSLLHRVIVSTDDKAIMDVSRKSGAEVPFQRPEELARDDSPHIDAVLHALEWLARQEKYYPDRACLLQPTSPLRSTEDIDNAIRLAHEATAEAVVSITEAKDHPFLVRRIGADGFLEQFVSHDLSYARRQNLPAAYALNGAIYVNTRESLIRDKTVLPRQCIGYIMPPERSLEIDTPWDFHLVELVLRDLMDRDANLGEDSE
jgi:CMP-N,N'-diacetyllegionaminic acid synthase